MLYVRVSLAPVELVEMVDVVWMRGGGASMEGYDEAWMIDAELSWKINIFPETTQYDPTESEILGRSGPSPANPATRISKV